MDIFRSSIQYEFLNGKLNGLYWWDTNPSWLNLTYIDLPLIRCRFLSGLELSDLEGSLEYASGIFNSGASLSTSLEPLTLSLHAGASVNASLSSLTLSLNAGASLSSSLERLTSSFRTAVEPGHGVIAASLGFMSGSFVGRWNELVGYLSPTTEYLTCSLHTGSNLSGALELISFFGVTGMDLTTSLEHLSVSLRSGQVEHLVCNLEDPEVSFYGDFISTGISLTLEELSANFNVGSKLSMSMENLRTLIHGTNGSVASLQAITAFLDLEFLSGTHLRARLETLASTFSGRNKNFIHLDASTEKISVDLLGTASIYAALDTVLRSAYFNATGTSYARSSDDLEVELALLKSSLTGHFSGYNTLNAELLELVACVLGIIEIRANLGLFLMPIEANMLSLNNSISCTPFETISHGSR